MTAILCWAAKNSLRGTGLDISSFFILNLILLKKYGICGLLKGKVACDSAVAGVPATALAVVPATALAVVPGNVPNVFLMFPTVSIDSAVADLLLPFAFLGSQPWTI